MEIYAAIVLFLQKPLGLIPIRCNSNSMLITRHLNSIMNQFTFISRSSYLLLFVLFFQFPLSAQDAEKKVALTTFFVDRQIDVSDLSGNAAFVAKTRVNPGRMTNPTGSSGLFAASAISRGSKLTNESDPPDGAPQHRHHRAR